MPRLEIYPDSFCRDLKETHQIPAGDSLDRWLHDNVKGYDPARREFTALCNGRNLSDYHRPLGGDDQVELVVRPQVPAIVLLYISLAITALSVAYQLYTYFTYSSPNTPKFGKASPVYDPNAQGNQARLRQAISEVFGRHKLWPDVISQPWREYINHEQWLHLLLCVGVGKYSIDPAEIFIGNTPISRYGSDVDYDIFDPGVNVTSHISHKNMYTSPEVGPTSSSGSGIQVMGLPGNGTVPGDWYGPYLACPLQETTAKFYLDFTFPGGLYRVNHDGDVSVRAIDLDIEYRDANVAGSWTSLSHTFSDNVLAARAYTIPITPSGPLTPEIRVRRVTGDSETQARSDKCFWIGLRSELTPATHYDDVTIFAISVKGSNVLAAQSENRFNLIATRKLEEISGGVFGLTQVATRKITSAFRYVLRDVGLADSAIDLDELQALESIWTPRADFLDGVFDQSSTLFEALKKILVPGYAVPLIENARFTAVRDEPRTVYEQMYQPDNMRPGGIERDYTLIDEDEPDGIEVTYFSSDTWKPETVIAQLPTDAAATPATLDAFGITDRDRAWRLGMRKRRERAYRRAQFRFATELDGLNSRFGSFCALGDDLPGYSQTGLVTGVDGRTLTLSNALDFDSDSPSSVHFIALRTPEGTLSGPYIAEAGDDAYTVTIDDDLDFVPVLDGSEEPPIYQFGTALRMTEPVIITEVKPQGVESVDLIAVNYDDRVYDDDDNLAPS